MSDLQIFDNAYQSTRTLSAATMKAIWYYTLPGGSQGPVQERGLPMFMTGVIIDYNRSVSPMYVLNPAEGNVDTQLNLISRPAGTLQVGSIITADQKGLRDFINAVGVTCSTESNSVNIKLEPVSGKCGGVMHSYILMGVVLGGMRITVQSGAVATITDQLTFSFVDLRFDNMSSDAAGE